jgi:membrane protein YqaA with SNARE-associated domain
MEALHGPLFALFAASFVAATLFPLPSEAALFAYLQANPANVALAVTVATVGNTLGGMTGYLIGRFIPQKQINPRVEGWIKRFGAPVTFFAWLPVVGDALCVVAGWLRIHWAAALAFMAAGRLLRYFVIAYLSSAV